MAPLSEAQRQQQQILLRQVQRAVRLLLTELVALERHVDRSEVGHWQREVQAIDDRAAIWLERGIPEVVRCEVVPRDPPPEGA